MSVSRKESLVAEFDQEDLQTAQQFVSDLVRDVAETYLEKGRAKAAKKPLRRLYLPHYWLSAFRMRRDARQLRALTPGSEAETLLSDCFRRYLSRHPALVLQELGALIESTPGAARVICDLALQDNIDTERLRVLSLDLELAPLLARDDLEGISAFANKVIPCDDIPEKARRRILRERAMILAVRDYVPEPAPKPDWSVPGRIVYVAASSLPYSVTGYTTRTEGVALGYKGLGFDVRVVTKAAFPINILRDLKPKDVPEVETVNGMEYHRLTSPKMHGNAPIDYTLEAADVLTEKLRSLKPEVVIAASNYENALPALIAARRLGLPFHYEIRGFWELSRVAREPEFMDSRFFKVMQLLEAFAATKADKVLTLTAQMRDDLVDRGVPRDKISLMPNAVPDNFVGNLQRDDDLAQELGLPPGCPVIGYLGSILEYEGLQDLATACAGLARRGMDFRLLLVGSEKPDDFGNQPITDEIRGILDEAGVADRLIMPGRVPFSEIKRYYSLIDIAPIPRRPYDVAQVVSPIKPIEAMAMAKAVVVSDVAVLRDLLEDEVTGMIFRSGDPADLEQKLARLLSDAELLNKLQTAGQAFVRDHRTWSSVCGTAAQAMQLVRPNDS